MSVAAAAAFLGKTAVYYGGSYIVGAICKLPARSFALSETIIALAISVFNTTVDHSSSSEIKKERVKNIGGVLIGLIGRTAMVGLGIIGTKGFIILTGLSLLYHLGNNKKLPLKN